MCQLTVMTIGMTMGGLGVTDDDPLSRYCGAARSYMEKSKTQPRKLDSYLTNPDDPDKKGIMFEIQNVDEETQEYELLYVSRIFSFLTHCLIDTHRDYRCPGQILECMLHSCPTTWLDK